MRSTRYRLANLLSDTALYSWHLIGSGERDQASSDGIRVSLDYTLSDEVALDLVIVVGGIDIEQSVQRVRLGLAAQAGAEGRAARCALHWVVRAGQRGATQRLPMQRPLGLLNATHRTVSCHRFQLPLCTPLIAIG